MRNKEISNFEIVLYALYLLGGWQKRIHTEDVALKCFQIAPTKFSWIKYPKYPDLTPARFALESAKKEENGSLVEGESERKKSISSIGGWRLTSKGVLWIKNKLYYLERVLGKHRQMGNRLYDARRLKLLLKSTAFQKYQQSQKKAEISHAEFAESLICTVNTEKKILNDRLDQLYATAEKLNREEVKNYVGFCKERFKNIIEI